MSITEILQPLAGGRMSAEIVGQFLPLIRNGRLQPGDRLPPERVLSETFGVGRATVRDALRVLEVMGLVEIRLGSTGGAFVTVPSTDLVGEGILNMMLVRRIDPAQIAETRALLELAILDLALTRITDEEISQLREECRHSRELVEAGTYDTDRFRAFHTSLACATHNDAVALMAESFTGPLSLGNLRASEEAGESARRTVEEHDALVEAVERRDAATARKVLRDHLLRNVSAGVEGCASCEAW